MELFTQLFGDVLAFVYHCFDRIVIYGYLSGLSRPEQVVHFFRNVVGVATVSKEVLSQRTADYQTWVDAYARNHRLPIEWAEKGVRKEDHVLPWQRRMAKRGTYGVYFIFKSMRPPLRDRKFADSSLEGSGFELPVPLRALFYAFADADETNLPGQGFRDRKFADSSLEGDGFEPSVPRHGELMKFALTPCRSEQDSNFRSPGDGELCWGALTLGCIRGDRSAGAGTVQCDFFCSAGFENAQATRFFPAQHDVPTRQRSQQPTP